MKKGKIAYNSLIRSVLRVPFEKHETDHVAQDGVYLCEGDHSMVSVNTTVSSSMYAERFSFYRAFNNALAGGMIPKNIFLSMTLPISEKETRTRERMERFQKLCEKENVRILGGHTAYSDHVMVPVFSVTVYGETFWGSEKSCIGKDIIITGFSGDAGASLILDEREAVLKERYSEGFLYPVKDYSADTVLSCTSAAEVFRKYHARMHDISEGGVLGALYELAEELRCGFRIDQDLIPVHQETIEICNFFDINPYCLLSTGCMLGITDHAEDVIRELEARGIPSAVLGKTENGRKKILLRKDEERYLDRPSSDPIMELESFG